MAINWDSIEEEYKGGERQFKDYAPEGRHKVKLNDVEIIQKGDKGNYLVKFKFEETDTTQYQTADYWISKDKTNWRIKHMKDLLTYLSGNEENAKKVCEMAESKDDFEYAVKGYSKAFEALAKKKPSAEIEVYFSGNYSKKGKPINYATFTGNQVYMKPKKLDNPLAGAKEVSLDSNDIFGKIPF